MSPRTKSKSTALRSPADASREVGRSRRMPRRGTRGRGARPGPRLRTADPHRLAPRQRKTRAPWPPGPAASALGPWRAQPLATARPRSRRRCRWRPGLLADPLLRAPTARDTRYALGAQHKPPARDLCMLNGRVRPCRGPLRCRQARSEFRCKVSPALGRAAAPSQDPRMPLFRLAGATTDGWYPTVPAARSWTLAALLSASWRAVDDARPGQAPAVSLAHGRDPGLRARRRVGGVAQTGPRRRRARQRLVRALRDQARRDRPARPPAQARVYGRIHDELGLFARPVRTRARAGPARLLGHLSRPPRPCVKRAGAAQSRCRAAAAVAREHARAGRRGARVPAARAARCRAPWRPRAPAREGARRRPRVRGA